MIIPVKGKKIRLSSLGSDINVLVNQANGEGHGTHVTTYKNFDGAQVVKLFAANFAMTFDRSAQGRKAFTVLMWTLQSKGLAKDEYFYIHTKKDFIEANIVLIK